MGKTREEIEQDASEAAAKLGQDYRDEQRASAEGARDEQAAAPESEEEYHERIRLVGTTGIFGDTDTTAGASASNTDVPSANNELATVAVAEKDAQAADGDDTAAEASNDEARRNVDAAYGTTLTTEEVEANANNDDNGDDSDDGHEVTAKEKIQQIEQAGTAEEVDGIVDGDDRVTVQRAAEKRKGELAS